MNPLYQRYITSYKFIMVNPSTKYYRNNRTTKKVIHCCSHCDYSTTNTRIQLINHVNAKHVLEKDRPYQCEHCDRGFAQKAHLSSHLQIEHDISQPTLKVISVSYIIETTDKMPRSTKTKARRQYYVDNSVINTVDINNMVHEYLPGVYIKKHDIHYDALKGFITLSKCQLHASTNNQRCITIPKLIIAS